MGRKYGLIGKSLRHSFSKKIFEEKFLRERLKEYSYHLYELSSAKDILALLQEEKEIKGLNVTTPYKEKIIPYLDHLNTEAATMGAVNVIKVTEGKTIGYNTDSIAFLTTLQRWASHIDFKAIQAIILGTGGASKAVQQGLQSCGTAYVCVSRQQQPFYSYEQMEELSLLRTHQLVINTTPLGMMPNTTEYPPIPYHQLTHHHLVYDLIYNPSQTLFLQKATAQGAHIKNGLEMLHLQAEKSWGIWHSINNGHEI